MAGDSVIASLLRGNVSSNRSGTSWRHDLLRYFLMTSSVSLVFHEFQRLNDRVSGIGIGYRVSGIGYRVSGIECRVSEPSRYGHLQAANSFRCLYRVSDIHTQYHLF